LAETQKSVSPTLFNNRQIPKTLNSILTMNKNASRWLPALALSLWGPAVLANDIEPGKEFYTVPRAANPIVLDGDLSEWVGVPVLADPKFYVRTGFEGTPQGKGSGGTNATLVLFERCFVCIPQTPTYTGPDDQTSAVQLVYDADNVYLGFVVTDEYHENAANSAWNGDSVQIMIANSNRTEQVALYNYALGGIESALGSVIVQHEAGPGGTEAVVTRNTTTKRTTYEIKLPKASLGLTSLQGGPQFGLGMAINDGDELAPGQGGWGGLGAHSIVFGKTPSETALITLTKGNDIEPGKEFYTAVPAPAPIVLDGVLNEWSAPVLADPKFYVRTGFEGSPQGKGSAGVDATLVLFERCFVCIPQTPTYTGPDDQTSAVQLVYDADNVYLGFVVTDEYHENAANSAWNGDSVQIMIADSNRTQQVALYNYALGGIESALGSVIVQHEAGPGGTEGVVTRNITTKRTTYEIKLPVASLGLTGPLAIGAQFGLGMAINDGDELAPGQGGWGGLGAHSIVFGKTPSETALITLGTAAGGDRIFLSAINPTVDSFSFRANDKGLSIVDPTTASLTIDSQSVPLTAGPRMLDAIDFTYRPVPPFNPGPHTYAIRIRDTLGTLVTDSGSFVTPTMTTLSEAHQATSVDRTKPGFIWKVFENRVAMINGLAQTEQALVGQLPDEFGFPLENLADPAAIGAATGAGAADGTLVRFEIPTVINLSQMGGEANGNFTPDDQMPGVPGSFSGMDGIAAEIVTFVEFPVGLVTLGVTSDDGFLTQGGFISSPATGLLLGQSETTSTTTFQFLVRAAGVYPIRTIYYDNLDAAHIELFRVKSDGTRVLLNDIDNGGFRAFRAGVVPIGFPLAIAIVGGQTRVTWTEPGAILQESTDLRNWTDLLSAASPYLVTGARPAVFYRLRK
jgi:hypothetical protein